MGNPVGTAAMKILKGIHTGVYRMTGGRVGSSMADVPILLLTTTGRTSGKPRTSPVMDIRVDGTSYVIASNNGADEHPAWFRNLEVHPQVEVQQGDRTLTARAVVLEGAERDRIYAAARDQMSNFGRYETKTSRTIPVVRLDPVG